MILAGDIGGTKTHLILYDVEERERIREQKYASQEHETLSEILSDFLSGHEEDVGTISLGIAGPVVNRSCRATNLPWVVDADELMRTHHISNVYLINDLEANAYGLKKLSSKEFCILNEGDKEAHGNAALIAAGTGLGEAGLYWDGKKQIPFATEGGHCGFAPKSDREIEVLRFLKKKFDHVSYERILSGAGLLHLYRYFVEIEEEEENEEIEKLIAEKKDPARLIHDKGLSKESKACAEALALFVSVYGAEAGNLALKMMATGGVYVGGGIAPKVLELLKNGAFMKAFVDKGRFSEFLSHVPVKVILNENTALLGAIQYAQEKI
jgi:glucokinase